MDKEVETWKDIELPGIKKGLYQISNLGRVKSLPRFRENGHSGYIQKEKIKTLSCKKNINNSINGYLYVNLYEKKSVSAYVHRLVGLFFIPNPLNLPEINHINFNKQDNIVTNLEWISSDGNRKHAIDNGRLLWHKNNNLIKEGLRNCLKCNETKQISDFYFNTNKNKYLSYCKKCSVLEAKKFILKNKGKYYYKEKNKLNMRKYRQDNEKYRQSHILYCREYKKTHLQYFKQKQNENNIKRRLIKNIDK